MERPNIPDGMVWNWVPTRYDSDVPRQARNVDRGEPRTRLDYFDAGMEFLAIGGVQSVTIANLCARLRVTKGSFYHHFQSGDQFKIELLAHWASACTQQVEAAASQVADPLERLEKVRQKVYK